MTTKTETPVMKDAWIDLGPLDEDKVEEAREDGKLHIAEDVMLRIHLAIAFGTDMYRSDVY